LRPWAKIRSEKKKRKRGREKKGEKGVGSLFDKPLFSAQEDSRALFFAHDALNNPE
jgi:hypothetical protein